MPDKECGKEQFFVADYDRLPLGDSYLFYYVKWRRKLKACLSRIILEDRYIFVALCLGHSFLRFYSN